MTTCGRGNSASLRRRLRQFLKDVAQAVSVADARVASLAAAAAVALLPSARGAPLGPASWQG